MKRLVPLALLLASAHAAVAQNNVCLPFALGVPTREGPPKWIDWTGSGPIAASGALDDPRWLGATGHSFDLGSATAPLHSRALYWSDGVPGGKAYWYFSFIVDLDQYDTVHNSGVAPRDVFVGFHRPGALAGGTEHGYVFQFHLTGAGAIAGGTGMVATAPTPCESEAACGESAGIHKDYWRIWVDKNISAANGCTGASGREFEPLPTSRVPWMTNTTPAGQDAVRYWKIAPAAGTSPLLENRWAVQVRVPVTAATGGALGPLDLGIERGSTFFYEATAKLAGAGVFAKVGWYPPTMTTSICPNTGSDTLISDEMSDPGGVAPGCTSCSLAKLAKLTEGTAADCDGGIQIDRDHVGTYFNTPVPATAAARELNLPSTLFGALASGPTAPNHIVALPFNTNPIPAGGGDNSITAPLMARFRLAGWGSAPWSNPLDTGVWKDIRGAGSGVCAAPPVAGDSVCHPVQIQPQDHGLITFDWTIGSDPTLGLSEYCEFGLALPGGAACDNTCVCADGSCTAGHGTRAPNPGGGFYPCVASVYQFDQCMLVELTAPNGAATFVNQSIWNNMTFGEMSIDARVALIDARQLPKAADQRFQDIYFITMPRNMPASVPSGTTGLDLVQRGALAVAQQIAQPYIDDIGVGEPGRLDAARKKVHHGEPAPRREKQPGTPGVDEAQVQKVRNALQYMPDQDFERVEKIVALVDAQGSGQKPTADVTHQVVSSVGSTTAAAIVPTLEIYPFYRPYDRGSAYEPMTSFSVFLSHENALGGMRYEIDGADKVADNVYHLRIPVGFARQIQVRAQAITPPEAAEAPGNPKWPCAGGCGCAKERSCGLVATLGQSAPGVLAGAFFVGRRRRKKARA